jgi:DnaK suppressor protein
MTSRPDPADLLAADRTRTLDRLAGLDRELAGIIEAAQSANADDEHDPEGATIAYEREHGAALVAQARRHLAEIDAARRRLDDGSYGICVSCSTTIAAERLAARPTAATCIACAAQCR